MTTPENDSGARRREQEERLRGWFVGRLPDGWFEGAPSVTVDREEIVVVGTLPAPDLGSDASEAERAAAFAGRAKRFREETREQRMAVAREAEHTFGRKVAWGVSSGTETHLFTHLAVPVMTRLRQPERRVLDTLVDAGVARSRADALAWCVRLVGQHSESWLAELREALEHVERVRDRGPEPRG
ncbi:hypothetical protein CLV35_0152 [Motilibacter peucedani]|uniref:Smu12A n=1 Tax=Motilibacter peucedani TaxID=598650 RepID=A0A420XV37_9ACTN|nr:hypothetical protein [Motilibacter peucedani]RKS80686.1 hypothetical protein CLV35_0152 [Motilibacter peucedani]